MNRIKVYANGSLYTELNVRCQRCDNPATFIIQAYGLSDYYCCSECRASVQDETRSLLQQRHREERCSALKTAGWGGVL